MNRLNTTVLRVYCETDTHLKFVYMETQFSHILQHCCVFYLTLPETWIKIKPIKYDLVESQVNVCSVKKKQQQKTEWDMEEGSPGL